MISFAVSLTISWLSGTSMITIQSLNGSEMQCNLSAGKPQLFVRFVHRKGLATLSRLGRFQLAVSLLS
jgi:hypothetical protein